MRETERRGPRGTVAARQENGRRRAVTDQVNDRPGYDAFVSEAEATVRRYSPAEAIDRVDETGIRYVDVRTAVECSEGAIPGAIHAPGGRLEARLLPDNPRYASELEDAIDIVFCCSSGSRSALAANRAQQLEYDRVSHLVGGITAWRDAGGPMDAIDDHR